VKLTHKIVQPFVYLLEEELPYKVTITDVNGYIVGSSDPSRLGQFHPSAYEILCGRKPIETLEQDEYVNLPKSVILGYGEKIIYEGECVGLIGLIGPPEERKKDIKTAQFILRLLLDREQAQAELDLIAADKNAFIVRLLHGVSEQESWLKKRAVRYGISIELPRYIAVVKVRNLDLKDRQPLESAKIRKGILQNVRKMFPDPEEAIYEAETGEIVILTSSGRYKAASKRAKATETALMNLYDKIKEQHDIQPLIGVSEECENYLCYSAGYQQALSAIEIGEQTEPEKGIYYYEQMRLGRIVSALPNEIRPILQEGIIDRLICAQGTGLLETLRVYYEQNMNVSETANALFIHRNTLQYRFKQIKDITGYDIRKVDDMIQLRLAVLQYQLFGSRENGSGNSSSLSRP